MSEVADMNKLRLLFVDDQAESAQLMANITEANGHYAKWTTTEAEAKVMLSSQEWDGLITDWWLAPEKIQGGGGRLIAWLHSIGSRIPCIIVTAFAPIEFSTIGAILESLGNVVVLHKPQDPSSLVKIIKGMIDAKGNAPLAPTATHPIAMESTVKG